MAVVRGARRRSEGFPRGGRRPPPSSGPSPPPLPLVRRSAYEWLVSAGRAARARTARWRCGHGFHGAREDAERAPSAASHRRRSAVCSMPPTSRPSEHGQARLRLRLRLRLRVRVRGRPRARLLRVRVRSASAWGDRGGRELLAILWCARRAMHSSTCAGDCVASSSAKGRAARR